MKSIPGRKPDLGITILECQGSAFKPQFAKQIAFYGVLSGL